MEVLVCRENMFFGEKIPSAPRFFSDFGQLLFVLLPSFLPTIETHPSVLFVVVRVFVVITADFFFEGKHCRIYNGKTEAGQTTANWNYQRFDSTSSTIQQQLSPADSKI